MGNFLAGIKGRLLAWAIVAAVIIPCALCGISQANKPETYPGDTIAWRECRDCHGSGCNLCDGKGKLWVITPGPNHPSWVQVRTYEAKVPQPDPAQEKPEDQFKPLPGAVGGARIAFQKDGKTVEATGTFTGRTRVRLAPGTWSYTIKREGFKDVTGTLDVATLKAEIWKTKSAEDSAPPLMVPMEP